VLVNSQHGIQRRGQDFDKKSLYLKGYAAKTLIDKFPEKSWTKRGVNKLLKKLWDTCTVDRRPVSSRPRSARTEENVDTVNDLVLSQEDKLQTHRTVREISRETGIIQSSVFRIIMAALCNRAGHYIFALWFLSIFYLSFFIPRLISAAADWMSTILLHMVWP